MTARIIAGSCKKHMIHLPIESIVSKWYGESEKSLTKVNIYFMRCAARATDKLWIVDFRYM